MRKKLRLTISGILLFSAVLSTTSVEARKLFGSETEWNEGSQYVYGDVCQQNGTQTTYFMGIAISTTTVFRLIQC